MGHFDITLATLTRLKQDREAAVVSMRLGRIFAESLDSAELRAKLLGEVEDCERIIAAIDAELARRGIKEGAKCQPLSK